MTQGIYAITNKANGKAYIGSSKNIESRFNSHKSRLNKGEHHSFKLQNDWNEYGEDSFELSIIQEVQESVTLFEIEQQFIDEYKAWQDYNIRKKSGNSTGRSKGYRKPDALIAIDLPIALNADTAKWFKAIPRGKKAQIIRDAIALYRITNEVTGER